MLKSPASLCFLLVLVNGVSAAAGDFSFSDNGQSFSVADHGRPVLEFVYAPPLPPDGSEDEVTGPSHYIHPLIGLLGETVTGESASIWAGRPGIHWGWSRLGVAGRLIDVEAGQGGHREFERWLGSDDSGDEGVFAIQSAWISDSDGRARVMENMTVTVYPVDGNVRRMDIGVLIRNVSDERILLEGVLPGSGLTVALNPAQTDWAYSSAGGWKHAGDAPYLSPWTVCTYRDARRSTRSGIAILQDSRNPAYSSANWSISEDYRVTAGAPSDFKTELKTGDFLEFRYRIILFRSVGGGPNMTAEYSRFMGIGSATN